MTWPVNIIAPSDIEAEVVSHLATILGSPVTVATTAAGYAQGDKRVLVHLNASRRVAGRHMTRLSFQTLAPSKEASWTLMASLINGLDRLRDGSGTSKITAIENITGPSSIPSASTTNAQDPARYALSLDVIHVV